MVLNLSRHGDERSETDGVQTEISHSQGSLPVWSEVEKRGNPGHAAVKRYFNHVEPHYTPHIATG